MQFLRKIMERFKIFGIWSTMTYLFFTVFLEKFGFHVEAVFAFQSEDFSCPIGDEFSFRVIKSMSELEDRDRTSLIEYGGEALIDDFSASFARGELCALGYWDQQLGCVCWGGGLDHHAMTGQRPVFLIWRCFTLPELRGRRLYPQTLFNFCTMLKNHQLISDPILIECSIFNQSSLKGIQKAGFQYKGKILRLSRWSKVFTAKQT